MSLWHSFMHQHYGRMMKILMKIYEDKLQVDVLEELKQVLSEQKYNHIANLLEKNIISANPPAYRIF